MLKLSQHLCCPSFFFGCLAKELHCPLEAVAPRENRRSRYENGPFQGQNIVPYGGDIIESNIVALFRAKVFLFFCGESN